MPSTYEQRQRSKRRDPDQWRAMKRRSRRQCLGRLKAYILAYRLAHPCKCGEATPVCLDFHHRDPSKKLFAVTECKGKSLATLIAEIKKCRVMCSNCHRKFHEKKRLQKLRADVKTAELGLGLV